MCPGGCGQPMEESLRPGAEDAYRSRRIGCHACAEQQKAQADVRDGHADAGIHIFIERIEPETEG